MKSEPLRYRILGIHLQIHSFSHPITWTRSVQSTQKSRKPIQINIINQKRLRISLAHHSRDFGLVYKRGLVFFIKSAKIIRTFVRVNFSLQIYSDICLCRIFHECHTLVQSDPWRGQKRKNDQKSIFEDFFCLWGWQYS